MRKVHTFLLCLLEGVNYVQSGKSDCTAEYKGPCFFVTFNTGEGQCKECCNKVGYDHYCEVEGQGEHYTCECTTKCAQPNMPCDGSGKKAECMECCDKKGYNMECPSDFSISADANTESCYCSTRKCNRRRRKSTFI